MLQGPEVFRGFSESLVVFRDMVLRLVLGPSGPVRGWGLVRPAFEAVRGPLIAF